MYTDIHRYKCVQNVERLKDPAVCVFVTGAARRFEERQRVKLNWLLSWSLGRLALLLSRAGI